MNVKKIVKKIIHQYFLNVIVRIYLQRPFFNVFKTKYKKHVLISYITLPFRKRSLTHTNFFEATCAAKIFHELGYGVDVIFYDSLPPNLKKYEIIYGFGRVFQAYFESPLSVQKKIKTICYGTGFAIPTQNKATLKRLKEVYAKKGVWLQKSARFVPPSFFDYYCFLDGIIALGNNECKKTYEKFLKNVLVKEQSSLFFKTQNAFEIINNKNKNSEKSFLWFGSQGLIHKGLDLCLEYFSTRPDLTLHICGLIAQEEDFVQAYAKELFSLPNICIHGFVDLTSPDFKEILKSCDFVILPSCSEGGAPSVLAAVGNGGLIPVISKETSVSTGFEISIPQLHFSGIEHAVLAAEKLSPQERKDCALRNLNYVLQENNTHKYEEYLRKNITDILENKKNI
jgi:glycosyltransferase involved in cell wall biosynthesis